MTYISQPETTRNPVLDETFTLRACEMMARPRSRQHQLPLDRQEFTMSKRARKRRSRKGKAANHGKKPNA
ncbi:hypothetical protein GCM10011492_00580 [Flexivirga endophytica]|uniref:Uncharacterized protein n=2 Tax=Flexivirga TaxID=1096776 RepID=A0A916SSV4_9MICO|nr:hypothetical protein [Flexivirga endophytica]GGB14789.1 hypothetical protein GCM10011492_00580 [Flexivirga endophytica]GHB65457.1 hypothetical protein GCM10008112_37920 [Flexivirga endophytica]